MTARPFRRSQPPLCPAAHSPVSGSTRRAGRQALHRKPRGNPAPDRRWRKGRVDHNRPRPSTAAPHHEPSVQSGRHAPRSALRKSAKPAPVRSSPSCRRARKRTPVFESNRRRRFPARMALFRQPQNRPPRRSIRQESCRGSMDDA
jgi:hypothetical protein